MGEISESMGRVRKPNGGYDLKMKRVGGIGKKFYVIFRRYKQMCLINSFIYVFQ